MKPVLDDVHHRLIHRHNIVLWQHKEFGHPDSFSFRFRGPDGNSQYARAPYHRALEVTVETVVFRPVMELVRKDIRGE